MASWRKTISNLNTARQASRGHLLRNLFWRWVLRTLLGRGRRQWKL